MARATRSKDGQSLSLETEAGRARFHAIWLRNNAPDPQPSAPDNSQPPISPCATPADTRITHHTLVGTRLTVNFAPEGKSLVYDTGWLLENAHLPSIETPSPDQITPELESRDCALPSGPGTTGLTDPDLTPDTIVAFLADIFERRGGEEYLGEPVTMAQHMLQGATIAQQCDLDEDTIVAALLHDIGHFTSEFGTFRMDDTEDRFHEHEGARVLSPFLPPLVIDCILHHVAAKRYLCATRPDYFEQLSEAAVHSLSLQGGPMSPEEVAEFETLPNLRRIIQVRFLDDASKSPNMVTPDFAHFAPMVQRVVDRHCERAC